MAPPPPDGRGWVTRGGRRPRGGGLGDAPGHLREDVQRVSGADAGADGRFEKGIRSQAGAASYVEHAQVAIRIRIRAQAVFDQQIELRGEALAHMGVQFIVRCGLKFMEGQVQEGIKLLHAAAGALPNHDRTDNRFGFHNSGSGSPMSREGGHRRRKNSLPLFICDLQAPEPSSVTGLSLPACYRVGGGAGMFKLFPIALIGAAAAAQTQIDLRTQARNVDFTAAASTKPLNTGTALPATCVVGDMSFKTDAPAGSNVYGCTAANTWAVQGNDTVMSGGSLVGNTGTVNFVTGTGLMTGIAAPGPQINVQTAVDTAVVQTQPGEQGGAALLCASGSGSGSAYRCSLNPTLGSYMEGMVLHWIPDVNGAGGATTLNVDALGMRPMKQADGVSNPGPSDIIAGQLHSLWYDGAAFRLTGGGGAAGSGGLADPGSNGVLYRNGSGTTRPASASEMSGPFSCQDAGSTQAYACNLSPPITTYGIGTAYWFQANTANQGPATINFNSLGAKTIKKLANQDLAAADIKARQWVMLTYDGTYMQMQSQTPNPASGGGAVSSVFGRSGAIVPQTGDYTAAQVTNAVDATASYSNPAWITALAYSKLSSAPALGTAAAHAITDFAASNASTTVNGQSCALGGSCTISTGSATDILRFGICVTAGCGSETTINYIATMGAGSFTECAFNLATAATGSSVIVDVQDGSGTSIFGATKLVVTVANGTAVEYQSTFANSPQTYARGRKYRAVVTQNDSGGTAQGGTVQCR